MSDVDNQTLNANNITVPLVYAPLFQDDYKRFILSSGRISGKTSMLVCLWWVFINKYPQNDIVILQATATEIKDSIINEIHKFLKNSGYDVGYDNGYHNGYKIGESKGLNSEEKSFANLVYSIIDAPFNVLSNAFNFDILGVNLSYFLIAIVSLLLVFFVIRKLL